MTPEKAQQFIGLTCRVSYINLRGFRSSRVGVVTNVSVHKLVLLLMEDEDYEVYIPLKGARVYQLKEAELI